MQLSPMVQEAQTGPDKEPSSKRSPMEHVSASQVGDGVVESLTKAASEPQVITVEAAVPEIAALPEEQLAVQDPSKTVSVQSCLTVDGGRNGLRSRGANLHE